MSEAQESKTANAPVGVNHTVKALRHMVTESKPLHDVCQVFSKRERARRQVTITRLTHIMAEHGGKHTKEELREVLTLLAKAGVGKLDKDPKGNVRALKDIKYTLRSVGNAALGLYDRIKSFSPVDRLQNVPAGANSAAMEPQPAQPPAAAAPPQKEAKAAAPDNKYPVYIVAIINGKRTSYYTGLQLTKLQIGAMLVDMHAEYQDLTV